MFHFCLSIWVIPESPLAEVIYIIYLSTKGYSQVEGIDYSEIFSPVIRYESICLMFTLVALKNWYITGLDVKTAFLYGKLNEEIYMKQPEGFTT